MGNNKAYLDLLYSLKIISPSQVNIIIDDIKVEKITVDDFKIDLDLPEKTKIPRWEEIKKELFHLSPYWILNSKGKEEHDALQNEWVRLQDSCGWHQYEIIYLVTVKRICPLCGHEDKTYNHFRDGKNSDIKLELKKK